MGVAQMRPCVYSSKIPRMKNLITILAAWDRMRIKNVPYPYLYPEVYIRLSGFFTF